MINWQSLIMAQKGPKYGGGGVNTVGVYFPVNCVLWFNYYDCINDYTLICNTVRFVNLQLKNVSFPSRVWCCLDYWTCSCEGSQRAWNFCSELRFVLFQSHLYHKIMTNRVRLGSFQEHNLHTFFPPLSLFTPLAIFRFYVSPFSLFSLSIR